MTVTREELVEDYPDLLFCDGHDDALIGVAHRFGMEPVALYDRSKVIKSLMNDGMSWEEAEEFFSFNIIGGWHGEMTPVFADIATGEHSDPVSRRETLAQLDAFFKDSGS
jgi:hypothetical protein